MRESRCRTVPQLCSTQGFARSRPRCSFELCRSWYKMYANRIIPAFEKTRLLRQQSYRISSRQCPARLLSTFGQHQKAMEQRHSNKVDAEASQRRSSRRVEQPPGVSGASFSVVVMRSTGGSEHSQPASQPAMTKKSALKI